MGDGLALRELYEARRLEEAWAEYERLHQGEPCTAEDHLYGALTAWRLRDLKNGRLAAGRGLAMEPNVSIELRLRFINGVLAREAGDSFAVDELQIVLAMLPQVPDLADMFRGSTYYNLALALQQSRSGQLAALENYLLAIAEFRATGMDDYRRQALQNAAWVAADLGDTEQAAALLSESEGLCRDQSSEHMQQIALAHLSCRQKQHVEAAELATDLLRDELVATDVRSLAASVSADVLLQQGRYPEAVDAGALAVSLALQTVDQRCLSEATRIHTAAKQAMAGAG